MNRHLFNVFIVFICKNYTSKLLAYHNKAVTQK